MKLNLDKGRVKSSSFGIEFLQLNSFWKWPVKKNENR